MKTVSLKQISQKLQRNYSTIHTWCKRSNIAMIKTEDGCSVNKDDADYIYEYAKGRKHVNKGNLSNAGKLKFMSIKDVAQSVKRHYSTILAWASELRIPIEIIENCKCIRVEDARKIEEKSKSSCRKNIKTKSEKFSDKFKNNFGTLPPSPSSSIEGRITNLEEEVLFLKEVIKRYFDNV